MLFIRQGSVEKVVVGPAVAVGDGFTPVTTLAVSSADDAEAILHDNGTVVDISGYTWAAIATADGYYHLTLQSGISGTVGHMIVIVNDDSLILPLRADFTVLEEAVYDELLAGSALGYIANAPVNVAQISADSTAADNAEAFFDGNGYAGTGNVIPTVTTLTGHTAQTGDTYALANGAAGFVAIDTVVDALTTTVGAAGVGLSNISLPATGLDLVLKSSTYALAIADAIWDEVLTGATHNVASSAGKRLRTIDAAFEVLSGTATAGSSTTITFEAGADAANDNIYSGDRVVITAGTGAGEHGLILSYASSTLIATMSKAWVVTPDNTSEYTVVPADCDVELWNDNTVTGDGDWAAMQADLDTITGSDGVTLASAQGNYAPSVAGDEMDLVNAPNATAITAIITAMGTGTFLTAIPWNASWDAEVQSECTDALNAYDPPTNTEMEARTIVAASYFDPAADAVASVTLVGTTTTNTDLAATKTVVDAIKVITDALGATGAARLALSAGQIIPATVDTVTNTHTPTTTEFQADDITQGTADHYNGRIIVFTSGALAGQATDITDYVAVGGIGQFTVTAMTEAPANNDTFIIL